MGIDQVLNGSIVHGTSLAAGCGCDGGGASYLFKLNGARDSFRSWIFEKLLGSQAVLCLPETV
jgi:hypothetical protein